MKHEAQSRVLVDHLKAVEDSGARVDSLTQSIAELVETWSRKPLVTALQSLRGISLVSAVVLAAELGDLRRFRKATELMGYLGLVPSEHSSGDSKRQGRMTRTGNGHARRILVEGAWAYRYRPAMTRRIRERSDEASPAVKAIAWKAQERLCSRYRKLQAKGKSKQRTIVALAREMAGFIWAIGQQVELAA